MKATNILAAFMLMLLLCPDVKSTDIDTLKMAPVPTQLKKELALKLNFPQEAIDLKIEGAVTTCFLITPEGRIKINCMNGHPVLMKYLRNRLESLHVNVDMTIENKPMIVRFNFKNRRESS